MFGGSPVFTPCGHVRAEPLLISLSLLLLFMMLWAPMSIFIGSFGITQCVLLAGVAVSSKTEPLKPAVLMAVVVMLWINFFGTMVNILLNPSYWRGAFGHVHKILYPNNLSQACGILPPDATHVPVPRPESNHTVNWRFELFLITAFFFFVAAVLHIVYGTLFARSAKDVPRIRCQMVVILTCSAIRWGGMSYYELVDPEYMSQIIAFEGPFSDINAPVPFARHLVWSCSFPCMIAVLLAGNPSSICSAQQSFLAIFASLWTIIFGFLGTGISFEQFMPHHTSFATVCVALGYLCLLFQCQLVWRAYRSVAHSLLQWVRENVHEREYLRRDMTIISNNLVRVAWCCIISWHVFPVEWVLFEFCFPPLPNFQEAAFAIGDMVSKGMCSISLFVGSYEIIEGVNDQKQTILCRNMAIRVKLEEQFVAFVFHELRNPFNGLTGHLECLKAGIERMDNVDWMDREAQETWNEMKDDLISCEVCGDHMSAILNNVLDLCKIEETKEINLAHEAFSLSKLVDSARRLASTKRLQVRLKVDCDSVGPESIMLRGDPLRIRQVLVNLAHNALAHTPNEPGNFVRLDVTATMTKAEDASGNAGKCAGGSSATRQLCRLQISIVDTGCGIPDGKKNKIFERLYSDRSKVVGGGLGAKTGTGLGLVVARKIVQAMGAADLGVESPWWDPDTQQHRQGSKFYFMLNLECMVQGETGSFDSGPVETTRSSTSTQPLTMPRGVSVLLVDDSLLNRKMLARKMSVIPPFAGAGWTFGNASTIEEGLVKIGEDRYDVVWMDQNLGPAGGVLKGTDGIRLIRDMDKTQNRSQSETHRRQRILVLSSGNCTKVDMQKYMDAGADFAVGKPLPTSENLARLFESVFQKHDGW